MSNKRLLELMQSVADIKAKTTNLPIDPGDASDIAAAIAALDTLIDGAITKIDTIDTVVDGISSAVTAGFALTGNAVVAEVLATKTFYKDDFKTKLTGTMANNTGDVASVSGHMGAGTVLHVVPATGYTDGVDDATTIDLNVVDADHIAGNIKHNVALLGVTGAYDTEAVNPIAVETVLTGKIGFVNGTKITGTMANKAGVDVAATSTAIDGTTLRLLVPVGYYDGATYVTATDADFVAGNILDGVNIFGLAGSHA